MLKQATSDEITPDRLAELCRIAEAATPPNEQCPRCGVTWTLGRDVGGRVHTPGGMDCLRRQLAQAQERERAALVREAWLRRVVEDAQIAPQRAQEWMRANGVQVADHSVPMQRAVFEVYNLLVELAQQAEAALALIDGARGSVMDRGQDENDFIPPELVDTSCPVCDEPRLWCWCDGEKGGGGA